MDTALLARAAAVGLTLLDEHAGRRVRVLEQTSATQIEAWEQCPRRWFFPYVEGLRSPKSPAQQAGTEIDEDVQHYLKTAEVRESGWKKLVRALAPLLPDPKKYALMVQEPVRLPTFGGGPILIGYVDLAWWKPSERLAIDDLKSTSDLKYAKTAEELLRNTQMMTYAKWGYSVKFARGVEVAHVYACRKIPKTLPAKVVRVPEHGRPLVVTSDHVHDEWHVRLGRLREMGRAARECARALDLTPNTASCDLYGGCFYRNKCGLSIVNFGKREDSMSLNSTSGLMADLMRQMNAKKEGVVPDGASAAAPASVPEVQPAPPKSGLLADLAARGHAQVAGHAVTPPNRDPGSRGVEGYQPGQACNGRGWYASANGQGFVPVEPGHACAACGGQYKPVAIVDVPAASNSVLPPDAPPRESTAADVEIAEQKAQTRRGRKPKVASAGSVSADAETPLPQVRALLGLGFTGAEVEKLVLEELVPDALEGRVTPGMLRQPGPASKNGTGQLVEHPANALACRAVEAEQRKLAEVKETNDPVGGAAVDSRDSRQKIVDASLALAAELEQRRASPAAAPHVRPVIYVDCLPVRGAEQPTPMEEWLAPIMEMAARVGDGKNSVADYRLIEYKAKGTLKAAVQACLATCPPALAVDSRNDAAQVVLEALVPHAALVVRGIR